MDQKKISASFTSFEDIPLCEICPYDKDKRKDIHGKKTLERDIKRNNLCPGTAVSIDHFEPRIKGRTRSSFGSSTSEYFVEGCVFVDCMRSYINNDHQL